MASLRDCLKTSLAFMVVLTLTLGTAWAAEFAGGTGQWDDPYRIATAEQLISIGSDWRLLESHFVLIADIDLDPNFSEDYAFTEGPIRGGSPVSLTVGGIAYGI